MGLVDKIIKKSATEEPNKLSSSELQLALHLLKQAIIKGEQVEIFYNLVVKLQNQYLEATNQQAI